MLTTNKNLDFLVHLGYSKCCWSERGVGRICLNVCVIPLLYRKRLGIRKSYQWIQFEYTRGNILNVLGLCHLDQDILKDSNFKLLLCFELESRLTINLSSHQQKLWLLKIPFIGSKCIWNGYFWTYFAGRDSFKDFCLSGLKNSSDPEIDRLVHDTH